MTDKMTLNMVFLISPSHDIMFTLKIIEEIFKSWHLELLWKIISFPSF